jgi:signal peptide peptidase SppA
MLIPKNDVYAMDPAALEAFLVKSAGIESGEAVRLADTSLASGGSYSVADRIATIPVCGVLLKSDADAQMFRAYGEEATGYGEIISAIEAAEADSAVSGILLAIDSPGGQVSGIHAVSDRVFSATKPTAAHIETLGASAAYWIASQADTVSASRGANVGSIGAYVPVVDMSKMAENAGIKVHVVSSGSQKGAGVPGAEVKPEHLAEIQDRINKIHAEFVADVVRGRGETPTPINESADGRVYSNDESVTRGLIDSVTSNPSVSLTKVYQMKDFAALIKDHPDQAALIGEKMVAGATALDVRAEIEKAKADALVANKVADAEAARDLALKNESEAKVQLAAAVAKVAELEKALADEKAKSDALRALGDGAKEAAKILADPPAAKVEKTAEEIAAMPPREQAKYYASLPRQKSK